MTQKELAALLESTGLPVSYFAFPEDTAPAPPFICYWYQNSNNFSADGLVYYKTDHVAVKLYTATKQPEYESKVEAALSGLFWEKKETYIESEKRFQIVYEMEV